MVGHILMYRKVDKELRGFERAQMGMPIFELFRSVNDYEAFADLDYHIFVFRIYLIAQVQPSVPFWSLGLFYLSL